MFNDESEKVFLQEIREWNLVKTYFSLCQTNELLARHLKFQCDLIDRTIAGVALNKGESLKKFCRDYRAKQKFCGEEVKKLEALSLGYLAAYEHMSTGRKNRRDLPSRSVQKGRSKKTSN